MALDGDEADIAADQGLHDVGETGDVVELLEKLLLTPNLGRSRTEIGRRSDVDPHYTNDSNTFIAKGLQNRQFNLFQ